MRANVATKMVAIESVYVKGEDDGERPVHGGVCGVRRGDAVEDFVFTDDVIVDGDDDGDDDGDGIGDDDGDEGDGRFGHEDGVGGEGDVDDLDEKRPAGVKIKRGVGEEDGDIEEHLNAREDEDGSFSF